MRGAKLKFLSVVLIHILFASSLFSADGQTLYKKCRGCHGVDGKHVPFERKQGVLAGKDKIEISLLINVIKDGGYPADKLNKIMRKIINKLSNEDIEKISEYIGNFKN